jgi:hypothetical protein
MYTTVSSLMNIFCNKTSFPVYCFAT